MGREAYSSSNNIWSAKRAAYRRICWKTLTLFWEFFRLFISFCFYGFGALFYLFILWLFMQLASSYCLPELTAQEVLPLPPASSRCSKTHFGNKQKGSITGKPNEIKTTLKPKSCQHVLLPHICSSIPTPNMVVCTLPSTHLLPLSLFRHVVSKGFQPPQISTVRTSSNYFEGPENVLPP